MNGEALLEIDRLWILAVTIVGSIAAWWGVGHLPVSSEDATHPHAGRFRRQVASLVVVIVATIAIIIALPVDADLRDQLLSLFGLALTAVLALSSTTFAANAMAGLMLHSLGNFRAGDFIRVAEHFGRVTERGLLHSEIQTEDRDLVTLPNLYLITQPVRVVRASGTILSCDVSLGYDTPRRRVTALLLEAAAEAELGDPFVQITGLGDFTVGYRISGLLTDVRQMVTARSALRARVMDVLHGADIEIASPSLMGQRPMAPEHRILPIPEAPEEEAEHRAEEVMFDKADRAARLEELQRQLKEVGADLDALRRNGTLDETDETPLEPERLELEQRWRERQAEALQRRIDELDPDGDGT